MDEIRYAKCHYCKEQTVLNSDEDIEGWKHGVKPLWIWDKRLKREVPNLIAEKVLCEDCYDEMLMILEEGRRG